MGKTTHGSTISLGGTLLTGVTSITLPSVTREMVDDTTHDNTTAKSAFPEDLYKLGNSTVVMDYIAGSPEDDACLAAMTTRQGSPVAVVITVKAESGTEDVSFDAYGISYEIGALPAGTTAKQQATLVLAPEEDKAQAATVEA